VAKTGPRCTVSVKEGRLLRGADQGESSHLKHLDGRSTVVPVHAGEHIGPGLLNAILNDVEMTRDQFEELL
jgi:hypothetical protein